MNDIIYCICECYFTRNIYIKHLDQHFHFSGKDQFMNNFPSIQAILVEKGIPACLIVKEDILQQIENEITKRKAIIEESLRREKQIQSQYKHVHPELLNFQTSFFDERFVKLINLARDLKNEKSLTLSASETGFSVLANRCFAFPVFTEDFCNRLMEEITNFENSPLPKERPNTMNNHGVLLQELGYQNRLLDPLRVEYLNPLAKLLFPEWVGNGLDSQRAFTVNYNLDKDIDLGYHYDNAEVTLNVCLTQQFEGGELYFGDLNNIQTESRSIYEHRLGWGVLHRGRQMHGAMPITAGNRCNLIIWMRSSDIRNKQCPMCNEKPRLKQVQGYGDGFTILKESCSLS